MLYLFYYLAYLNQYLTDIVKIGFIDLSHLMFIIGKVPRVSGMNLLT